ncbi:MAG: hypothetical protein ACXAB7_22110 [Candidatus Kariarchaeaceae archaeon]|jgi:hypothetical protein
MNTSIESISLHRIDVRRLNIFILLSSLFFFIAYILPELDRIDESDPYATIQRLHFPREPLYLELFAFVLAMQGLIYFAINSNNLFLTDDYYAILNRRLVVFLALLLPITSLIVVYNYLISQQNSFRVDLATVDLLLYTMSLLFSGSMLLEYYRKTSQNGVKQDLKEF